MPPRFTAAVSVSMNSSGAWIVSSYPSTTWPAVSPTSITSSPPRYSHLAVVAS